MIFNRDKSKLFVVNSNADSVSVIDTAADTVVEKINIKLAENALKGTSPESLALSEDEKTLYVANSQVNAVAVVALGKTTKLTGFVPTGHYPSAIAVVGNRLFIGNGKGTGFLWLIIKLLVSHSDIGKHNSFKVKNFFGFNIRV
jgi:YVTN family beta-propeller protein